MFWSWLKRLNPRLAFCMLLALLTYAATMRGEFVWDDLMFVSRWVGGTRTLKDVFFPDIYVMGSPFYYRPISQGYATLHFLAFGDGNEWGWHLGVIVLHVITTGLFFVFLRDRWLPEGQSEDGSTPRMEWVAAIGAAFYAVWPPNAESIAWISSRGDTLLGPFLLGALLLHLRSRDRGTRPFAAAFLFLLALLTKETAIVFVPIAILATMIFTARGPARERSVWWPWSPVLWLPYVLAYLGYSLLRKMYLGSGSGFGTQAKILIAKLDPERVVRAWGFYIQEALGLGASPPFLRDPPEGVVPLVFAAIGVVLMIACLIAAFRDRRFWMVGAFFLLPLGPPLAIVSAPTSQNSVTVHYLYLPNLAVAGAVAILALHLSRRGAGAWVRSHARAALALGLIACTLLSAEANRRSAPWMTGRAMWTRALEDNPLDCTAMSNLALAYWGEKRIDDSIALYERTGKECRPDSGQRHNALVSLAIIYVTQERYDDARRVLEAARAQAGHFASQSRWLGLYALIDILPKQGSTVSRASREELGRAIYTLEESIVADRFNTSTRIALGIVYSSVGDRVRAHREFAEVERIASDPNERLLGQRLSRQLAEQMESEPDAERRAFERAVRLELAGDLAGAEAAFRDTLAIDPDRADVMLALADVLARQRKLGEAVAVAGRATEKAPEHPMGWFNLGIYAASSGDFILAERAFGKAASLSPAWQKALFQHALMLERTGRIPESIAVYQKVLSKDTDTAVREAVEERIKLLQATQNVTDPNRE